MPLSYDFYSLSNFSPDSFSSLAEVLSPELIDKCLSESGVATLRKRRLPLDMMVWSIIGMSIFRDMPMRDIVNKLDILLPGNRPFVAPSAVVQARQRLGTEVIKKYSTKLNNSGISIHLTLTGAGSRYLVLMELCGEH